MVSVTWIFCNLGLKDGYHHFRGIREILCTTYVVVLEYKYVEYSTTCGAKVSKVMEEAGVCALSTT